MANVIVIGDKCTDKYIFGECSRLSPEQPVPVLDQTKIEERPGMAGNTELNLKAFGVNTVLLSQRESITKTRFVDTNSGYQLMRLDETPQVSRIANAELKMAMMHMNPDAIVISDYDKGYINDDDLWHLCNNFNRPVFVDTKKRRLFHKDNVFWKINKKEYDLLDKDHIPNGTHLIVTLGSRGVMWNGLIFQPKLVKVFVNPCTSFSISYILFCVSLSVKIISLIANNIWLFSSFNLVRVSFCFDSSFFW